MKISWTAPALLGLAALAGLGALVASGTIDAAGQRERKSDTPTPPAVASVERHTEQAITKQERNSMLTQAHSGKILHATETSFDQHVLNSDVPVLVDFYADWCGPCRALAPTLEQVAQELPNARVVKVNVDDNPELAQRYGVSSIPTLLVFRKGEIAAEMVGLASKSRLKSLLTM